MPGQRNEDRFEEYRGKRIFVLCERQQDFAVAYREQNQLAHWGVAIPEQVAIAWHGCKYLLWHEILHLMMPRIATINSVSISVMNHIASCGWHHRLMIVAVDWYVHQEPKAIQRYVTELSAIADFDCR